MMTSIVISKRDGVVKAPDGTQYRVHRGKTLANAQHPVVLAYPHDWMPVEIHLDMPGTGDQFAPGTPERDAELATLRTEAEEARNDLAEAEEQAEHLAAEMQRLAAELSEAGWTLPAEDDRRPGWLVDLVLASLADEPTIDVTPVDAEPETAVAPRPPRKRAPGR